MADDTENHDFDPDRCSEFVSRAPILSAPKNWKLGKSKPEPWRQKAEKEEEVDRRRKPTITDIPVVFVHGWVSSSTHNVERTGAFSRAIDMGSDHASNVIAMGVNARKVSLIDWVQDHTETVVYTFDYSKVNGRWVTDKDIGPKLARGLECLAKTYYRPAVAVAHSMGGLALRQAASMINMPIKRVLSHVFTIATPNEGSDLAAVISNKLLSPTEARETAVQKLLVSALRESAHSYEEKCKGDTGVPFVDAFEGEAGRALRTGSPELKQLPKMPREVEVHAVAGEIEIKQGVTLFGFTKSSSTSVGDVIVSKESALSGASANFRYSSVCTTRIVVRPMMAKSPRMLGVNLLYQGKKAVSSSFPCFHTNLTRETNAAWKMINVLDRAMSYENFD
ncbi:hypothetical protein QS713_03715 [Gleimia hominis]|uniref:Alpha/beta hydrolase n=1 Tax=Gleimia hominis TaxID=595468 RepID=A0ABU3I9Y1_9ACTO|nr:hypothetical protein [Gleimia hominis]MDT3767173.1 hypothetical protein [Gleimia hominis]